MNLFSWRWKLENPAINEEEANLSIDKSVLSKARQLRDGTLDKAVNVNCKKYSRVGIDTNPKESVFDWHLCVVKA
jgi:hypothetical protein